MTKRELLEHGKNMWEWIASIDTRLPKIERMGAKQKYWQKLYELGTLSLAEYQHLRSYSLCALCSVRPYTSCSKWCPISNGNGSCVSDGGVYNRWRETGEPELALEIAKAHEEAIEFLAYKGLADEPVCVQS